LPRNQAGWLPLYGTRYWLQRLLLGSRSCQRRQAPPYGLEGRKQQGGGEITDLKSQLRKLASDVLSGEVGRSEAAVVNQILNTRARLIELERRIREQEELTERLEALESVLKVRGA
jgi:hypothetical protein